MSMHHRRKPRFSEGTCSQYVEDNAESIFEAPVDIGPENGTKNEDASIVISDSDDMELHESMIPKKRRKPPLYRKPLPVKRKIAQMSEEEQLALAVEMSQQEQTKQEEYTQEEEDELIKKAIQESLHSCQVPDVPISARNETPPSSKEPCLSQVSRHSDEGLTKSPVVLLQRLSQDIVDSPCVVFSPNCKDPVSCIESRPQVPLSPCSSSDFRKMSPGKDIALSPVFPKYPPSSSKEMGLSVLLQRLSQDIMENSSVVLSPNCKDPVSCIETSLQSSLSPCTSNDFVKLSSVREVTLSPVFPKKFPYSHRRIPCRLFQERSQSADRLVDDLDVQLTHCSESPQMDSSPVLPTSSSQGESSYQNDCQNKDSVCSTKTKEIACEDNVSIGSTEYFDCRSDKCNQSGGTVHYYWGVPFCPKGVDPSEYTKVILCQLEVYQKSLKNAQRQLLHKMDYGQPIHLVASSQENSKEDPQSNISQEETEDTVAEDDTQKLEEAEQQQSDNSDSQDTQPMSSKRQKTAQTILENDHCSSSPNAIDSSKALFTKMPPSECAGVAPVAPGDSAVSPTAVRNDSHLMEHTAIAQEEDITVCPETQSSPAKQEESDKADQTDVMEIVPDPKACMSSEPSDEDITCLDKKISNDVACPMCDFTFPPTEIERHAAYCDGINFQQELTVLRSRNNLLRSRDRSVGLTPKHYGKSEKCYVCKSVVLLKDYQGHVDNCLQNELRETQESKSFRSIKKYPERNGRLLNMLEQSETSLAESNCNEPESSNLSPPRDEHVGRSSSEHEDLSDSPIRSFVSISEATDCLVDFKKQFSCRPSSRRSSRRGRGKRRRM